MCVCVFTCTKASIAALDRAGWSSFLRGSSASSMRAFAVMINVSTMCVTKLKISCLETSPFLSSSTSKKRSCNGPPDVNSSVVVTISSLLIWPSPFRSKMRKNASVRCIIRAGSFVMR